jgi:hypothetical protein
MRAQIYFLSSLNCTVISFGKSHSRPEALLFALPRRCPRFLPLFTATLIHQDAGLRNPPFVSPPRNQNLPRLPPYPPFSLLNTQTPRCFPGNPLDHPPHLPLNPRAPSTEHPLGHPAHRPLHHPSPQLSPKFNPTSVDSLCRRSVSPSRRLPLKEPPSLAP